MEKKIPCSWFGRLDVKIAIFPKLIHTFNEIPIRIPAYIFVEIDKLVLIIQN